MSGFPCADNFAALSAPVAKDTGADGVKDRNSLPLKDEPASFQADMESIGKAFK